MGRFAKLERSFSGNFRATLDRMPQQRHDVRMTIQQPHVAPHMVHFHRKELNVILSIYGRMVAAGEWRDYGISALKDVAVFSVFRRSAEQPLYRIEKRPKLALRQGAYSVVAMDGQILKRAHDLRQVLRVLERKLIRAVE